MYSFVHSKKVLSMTLEYLTSNIIDKKSTYFNVL